MPGSYELKGLVGKRQHAILAHLVNLDTSRTKQFPSMFDVWRPGLCDAHPRRQDRCF
jgi:hypothetical protein